MLLIGYLFYRKTNVVISSRWFGKLTTTVLYAVLIIYVLVPAVPEEWTVPATALCIAMIVMTFTLYNYDYIKQMKLRKKD
jgi:cardiolipin synthase